MKSHLSVLSVLFIVLSFLMSGCNRSVMEGGLQFCNIYILEDDELLNAQEYVAHFSMDGGEETLNYVGPAFFTIMGEKPISGISITVIDNAMPYVLAYEGKELTWCLQSIRIEVQPYFFPRKTECIVSSNYCNGYAARLTVSQDMN